MHGRTDLGLFDLEHLLVLLLVALDRLVEEEVRSAQTDTMAGFTVGWVDLLQLLEGTVRSHAPALGEFEGNHIRVTAADSRRPLPPE